MEEMDEEIDRDSRGPWFGIRCRQVALEWDVLGQSDEQIKAKMEEIRKATNHIWKEAGMSVL